MENGLNGSRRTKGKHLVMFLMLLFVLAIGIGIGTLITNRVDAGGPGDSRLTIQSDGKPLVGSTALALSQAFEEVASRVDPAVVNINTEEIVRVNRRRGAPSGDDPNDFFHRFFEGPNAPNAPNEFTQQSLGSGVLVDPKGYIITNNHVVESASKIKVNTQSGKEYTAKVIGSDPLSDIAVIKIDSPTPLPFAKIGNAKALKVGDWVLAIGSPFGLEHTVTAGIISSSGRVFDHEKFASLSMQFNDFLQTDAAINPGNSGGPLVNMNGEVVGINSFISTATRSNAGVGFAVPAHHFVNVYNQILERGKVMRGWLGVSMNMLPFTPAMAQYFGVKQGSGVLITELNDENGDPSMSGPAAKAGLRPQDVIVDFDGKKISTVQDLRLAIANTPPGQKVRVKAVRQGAEKGFDVVLIERTLEAQTKEQGRDTFSFDEREEPKQEMGLKFDNIPAKMAQELEVKGGALVISVKPGSLAEEAGLQGQEQGGNDIIVEANGKKIEVAQDLLNLVKGLKSGEAVVLKFLRVGQTRGSRQLATTTAFTSITKP
jgi:serine protease Do